MSAIFGIINKNGKPVEEVQVNAMKSSIHHRATDGERVYVHSNMAFGHCRLYVHPQQKFERQPFLCGNLIITADARLDNRTDLAKVLNLKKDLLVETSDDKLLLMAYQEWGKQCVDHLEGEYTFAIWDNESRELFAATDHIGFRPFFYYNSPDLFIFCSEIKGVVAAKPLPNYFEEESLIEYFYRKGSPNKTYNKEVFALCGGNTLMLKDGRIDIHKYWTLESTGKFRFKKDEEWYDCTRDLVYRAIEKRLNPEVPIGITLSGGLDSTSIACILSELLVKKNKPLYAFSSVLPVDYKGIEKDERPYIEIVGKHCPNIIQTYVEAPGVGPFSDLEKAFEIEETYPNTFFYMDRALLRASHEKGIKILYSGFGGDLWLSWKGQSVIYELMRRGHYKKAVELMRQFCKAEHRSMFQTSIAMYLSQADWYKKLRLFTRKNTIDWQNFSPLQYRYVEKYHVFPNASVDSDNTKRMLTFVNDGNLGRVLTQVFNRDSVEGINSSIPLVDKELFQLLSDLPLYLFLKSGQKRDLIRNIMNNVIPFEIKNRKDKLPFSPGYHARILSAKGKVNSIMNSPDFGFVFDKFIDKKIMQDHFDEIKPYEGFTPSNKVVGIKISHGGIACLSIRHLCKNNYIFE
jgi:asparagine synthase (glutamine-hydrolysing)